MTMGDAVASFLDKKDVTTKNMCLSTPADFRNRKEYQLGPRQWGNERYRWKDATSRPRRFNTVVIFLPALVAVSYLLKMGIDNLPTGTTINHFEFGAVSPEASIQFKVNPPGLILNAVIANTPQVVLSFLHFNYNAIYTAMLMGYEWVSYAHERKGLRVTRQPSGAQRSTYFLQLPYRFNIPLMVLNGTLHWLVSQSIFLIAIDFYDAFGKPGTGTPKWELLGIHNYKSLGYSPPAIITVIVLGGLMFISIVASRYIPYKRGMPLAGSCSLAISAACHPMEQGDDGVSIAEQKLKWGVIRKANLMRAIPIAVTGATGGVGGLVARGLAARQLPQRLLVRTPSKAPKLPHSEVRQFSYSDHAAASTALKGVHTLFMVSASESAERLDQHRSFVDAAVEAGVQHVVYTSFMGAAPDAVFTLARDHYVTEEYIKASGMRWTFLRDNLYIDFMESLVGADGVIRGPSGSGRVSIVAREDVARLAAAVLADPDQHAGISYDVTGREALSISDVAATISKIRTRDVRFHDETIEEAYTSRANYGVPGWQVDAWVSTYTAIGSNALAPVSDAVKSVTGCAPMTLAEYLAANP
ncbi:hypothetical protein G6011_07985 [Alternaria panax]|uniref:NAD(P)-binding domain-containing protein n=1 Tax=Alternaria panax TaxID=48097 RepID=A0AAD4I6J2_9PLEO|nr:hypothetical protein G6011_07985 [Alternaria panax]